MSDHDVTLLVAIITGLFFLLIFCLCIVRQRLLRSHRHPSSEIETVTTTSTHLHRADSDIVPLDEDDALLEEDRGQPRLDLQSVSDSSRRTAATVKRVRTHSESSDNSDEQPVEMLKPPSITGLPRVPPQARAGPWECPSCSFMNVADVARCDVCFKAR